MTGCHNEKWLKPSDVQNRRSGQTWVMHSTPTPVTGHPACVATGTSRLQRTNEMISRTRPSAKTTSRQEAQKGYQYAQVSLILKPVWFVLEREGILYASRGSDIMLLRGNNIKVKRGGA